MDNAGDKAGNVATPGQPGTTKLRILALLRRGSRTVPELATALSLTSNAVRTHLAALERDRLVAPRGHRLTARRPAATYTLTPLADQFLNKPYAVVLTAMLQSVKERYGESDLTNLLHEIGQRLGQERAVSVRSLSDRGRVESVAEVINDLGGVVEVEERNGQFILTGYSCPLVAVVAAHASVCGLMQTLIETLLGPGSVRECCDRRGEIRCRFAIDLNPATVATAAPSV